MTESGVGEPLTAVLVHGAFTDASSWAAVTDRLQSAGAAVWVPANPLRGLNRDGESIARLVRQIAGPVLLVGHAYGGAVITHAGSRAGNVRGLVFVASYGLERGQSIAGSAATWLTSLEWATDAADGAAELLIPLARFGDMFAADLSLHRQDVLAVSQRPIAAAAFTEVLGLAPAWKSLPSWFLITTEDRMIPPAAQWTAAKRMGATTLEVAASHAVLLSQPETVTVFILKALAALR
ncbi:alpha/beta fold hydrolase [Deinococcus psychrotolerans]|uniref:alpha/beta fold hydrolase n=1 Tax=Deinococcus psychrotolerans TaxID=2489213 RepID=UPI0019D2B0C0|nr:alpha/beta hydrolase [Deinococcus psychrotolerans]